MKKLLSSLILTGSFLGMALGMSQKVADAKAVTVTNKQVRAIPTPTMSLLSMDNITPDYYYYFSTSMPKKARTAFQYAIKQYNASQIVSLKPMTSAMKSDLSKTRQQHATIYFHMINEIKNGEVKDAGIAHIVFDYTQLNHVEVAMNEHYKDYTRNVAMHEMGHALGLNHNFINPDSVMNDFTSAIKLAYADKLGLKTLYK